MGGKSSRRKGHDWERKVAHDLRQVMPGCTITRGQQGAGGDKAPDVDAGPLWAECKVGKQVQLRAALRQAVDDAPLGRVPVAVCKDDRKRPFILMDWEDFLEMVEVWWRAANE